MPENNIRNNTIRRTADDNWILLAKNSARAYREIGVITEREYNKVRRTNDIDVIQSVIGDIPNMEVPMRLKFCRSFVADDTENFNGATPAILAYAYMATRGENTPMARALATRIDEMSADFANSGGMVLESGSDWPLVNLSNIADVYEGFVNALVARMADLDASRDAAKIAEMKSNLAQMETVINDYDTTWNLNKVRGENASQYEHRWDELNNALDGARLFDETKETVRKYDFKDENEETIPQFLENGELDPDGRAAALLDLTRGDIARRLVSDLGAEIDSQEIEQELNDEFLIKLYETANADKIVQMAMKNPEVFTDPQKRAEFIRGLGDAGGEISDAAYNAALDENANATAGWGARFKKKLGTAAEKVGGFFGKVFRRNEKVDRLSGVRMASQPVDMRQKRIELFKRVLKGFASAFIASAIITTVATAAAATAGISLAASMAAIGIITAIGMGIIQVRRWQKNHPDGQLKDMLKDTQLLTSLGVSAVAVVAMCFGAAGMAEAAMALGYGALALGGTKNAVEAYHDARNSRTADGKRMSVAESIAWAIANAGAVVAGGLTGRMAANAAIDAYNNANPENRLLQNANDRTVEHTTKHEITERHYDPDAIRHHEEMMIKYHWETPESFATKIDGLMDAGLSHDEAVRYLLAWHDTTSHNLGQGYFNSIGMDANEVAALRGSINGDTVNLTPESIKAFNNFNPHISETNTVGSIAHGPISTKLPANAEIGPDGKYVPGKDFYSTYTEHGGAPYQDVKVVSSDTTYENVTDYTRANGDAMAAFGNYNPREAKTTPRDRIGAFWDRIETEQPRREERAPVEPPVQDKPSQEVIIDDVPVIEEKPVVEAIVDDVPVIEEKPVVEEIIDVFPDPKKVTEEVPVIEKPQPEIIVDEFPAPEKTDIDFDDVFPAPIDNESENEPVVQDTIEFDIVPDDKILALTRPQAKAWHDLHARRNKVREKLRKSPHASKAAKLRAQESKLTYLINKLCNEVGHHDYAAIDRAANEALLREALNEKQALIDAGPGANATKWDIADWRADIAKLDRNIQKKIDKFGAETMDGAMADKSDLYFPSPVPGVQRQKKNARGDVKLPSENDFVPVFENMDDEIVLPAENENGTHKLTKGQKRALRREKKATEKDARRAEYERKMTETIQKPHVALDKSSNIEPVPVVAEQERQISTIRGVPVRLMNLDRHGGAVFMNGGKPVVVAEISQEDAVHDGVRYTDVIRIAFCLITRTDGRTGRTVKRWYPVQMLEPNGRMLINSNYGCAELLQISDDLNAAINDFDTDTVTHVDISSVIAKLVESTYANYGLYAQGVDYASCDSGTLSWALGKVKSPDYRQFNMGAQRIGMRLRHRFGFGTKGNNKDQY